MDRSNTQFNEQHASMVSLWHLRRRMLGDSQFPLHISDFQCENIFLLLNWLYMDMDQCQILQTRHKRFDTLHWCYVQTGKVSEMHRIGIIL